jgi:hypothetical protein
VVGEHFILALQNKFVEVHFFGDGQCQTDVYQQML